jgi:hypothetical protein
LGIIRNFALRNFVTFYLIFADFLFLFRKIYYCKMLANFRFFYEASKNMQIVNGEKKHYRYSLISNGSSKDPNTGTDQRADPDLSSQDFDWILF